MTKTKVADGIITNHIVSVEFDGDPDKAMLAVKSIAAFRSVEERIQELKDHLLGAAQNGGAQAKYAADSAEALENALKHLAKIQNPKERKAARDMAYCLLNACQSMWRVDVKKIEPQVVTGEKIRRGGEKGRTDRVRTSTLRKEAWQLRADQLRAEQLASGRPALSINKIAEIMEKEEHGPRETIRRAIK